MPCRSWGSGAMAAAAGASVTTGDRSTWAAFAAPLAAARDAGVAGVAFVNGRGQVLHSEGGLAKALPAVRTACGERRRDCSCGLNARHLHRTDAAAAFPQGSMAAILSGRFDFAPPTQAAPRDPTRAAEHAVGAARRDGASIVLGARKFLVTEADHCDLLAVSAAPGGGVPLGVFLAAVPFGAVAVLFR